MIEGAVGSLFGEAKISREHIEACERVIPERVRRTAAAIAKAGIRVVGCSMSFEQTAASVALRNHLKSLAPETVTLLGGANCEGEMARGILSLPVRADYVFSRESEQTFPLLLAELAAGRRPPGPIIEGAPCRDLDALPTPDYSKCFKQRAPVAGERLCFRRGGLDPL